MALLKIQAPTERVSARAAGQAAPGIAPGRWRPSLWGLGPVMRAASWNCAELPRAASAIPADVGINNSGVAKALRAVAKH